MVKCNKCGTIYNETQKQMLINNKQYWCPLCSTYYKIFNPFPAQYFQPELDVNYVLNAQIKMWECGTRDGYFRNKMKSADK
jgi:hypothetical protein